MRLFCFFFHREATDERWLWTPRSNSFHQKKWHSAVVARQKQTNGKRATEIHGCAYLESDSLRSPAQSVFRVPGLPSVCFCSVLL